MKTCANSSCKSPFNRLKGEPSYQFEGRIVCLKCVGMRLSDDVSGAAAAQRDAYIRTRVRDLFKSGESVRDIAERLGKSEAFVRQRIEAMNLRAEFKHVLPNMMKAIALINRGYTIYWAAQDSGAKYQSIQKAVDFVAAGGELILRASARQPEAAQ